MASNKFSYLLLFTLVFFNILFASAIISYRTVLKGEMVTLPNLIGKTLDEARAELAKRRLSVINGGERFDSRWERGKIIHQDPSQGSKLKINKSVKVIMSAGTEKVMVPQFIGKNFQAANEILSEAGLVKGKISQVHTSKYAAGKILAQNPLDSQEVARNTPVSLLVSQGEREQRYLMLDLIGKRADRVIAKLRELNFRVEDARPTYYPGLDPGIIIKQFPPHGFMIQKNYPITLEVSK